VNWFYVTIGLGILLWSTIVFQTLLGLRIIKFKGALHAKVHRWIAFALIAFGLVHGFLAFGTMVFGWF